MYEDITCGQNLGLNRLVCINAHTGKHLGQHIYKGSKRWGVQPEGGKGGGGGGAGRQYFQSIKEFANQQIVTNLTLSTVHTILYYPN